MASACLLRSASDPRRRQSRDGVRENLPFDAIRIRQGIAKGQSGTERLTAQPPALDSESAANAFKDLYIRAYAIGAGVAGRRRSSMSPELDDDRPAKFLEALEIGPPLRAAGKKAVNQQESGKRVSAMNFNMRLDQWRVSLQCVVIAEMLGARSKPWICARRFSALWAPITGSTRL